MCDSRLRLTALIVVSLAVLSFAGAAAVSAEGTTPHEEVSSIDTDISPLTLGETEGTEFASSDQSATDAAVRSFNTTNVDPGDRVEVTTTYEMDTQGSIDIIDEFDPAVNPVDGPRVSLDDERIPAFIDSLGDDDMLFISDGENVGPGTLEVTYVIGIPDDADDGDTFTVENARFDAPDGVPVEGDSTITVGDPPQDARFQVDSLDAPVEVEPGEELTVSATVSNDGAATGTEDVLFQLDTEGNFDDPSVRTVVEDSLTLSPDETHDISTTVAAPDAEGEFEHGVFAGDASQTTRLNVAREDDNGDDGNGDAGNGDDGNGDAGNGDDGTGDDTGDDENGADADDSTENGDESQADDDSTDQETDAQSDDSTTTEQQDDTADEADTTAAPSDDTQTDGDDDADDEISLSLAVPVFAVILAAVVAARKRP